MSQIFACQKDGCDRQYSVGGRRYDATTMTWAERKITDDEKTFCPQHRAADEDTELQQTAPIE